MILIKSKNSNGGMKRQITVQCFPLYSVLKAIGNPIVDYFSLDIEGPEFQVGISYRYYEMAMIAIYLTSNFRLFSIKTISLLVF